MKFLWSFSFCIALFQIILKPPVLGGRGSGSLTLQAELAVTDKCVPSSCALLKPQSWYPGGWLPQSLMLKWRFQISSLQNKVYLHDPKHALGSEDVLWFVFLCCLFSEISSTPPCKGLHSRQQDSLRGKEILGGAEVPVHPLLHCFSYSLIPLLLPWALRQFSRHSGSARAEQKELCACHCRACYFQRPFFNGQRGKKGRMMHLLQIKSLLSLLRSRQNVSLPPACCLPGGSHRIPSLWGLRRARLCFALSHAAAKACWSWVLRLLRAAVFWVP